MRIVILCTLAAAALSKSAAAQSPPVWPDPTWKTRAPEHFGIDRASLEAARDYALGGGGAGMVIFRGYLIYSWGNTETVYELRSTSKSIGAMTVGLAVNDGLLGYDDVADDHHPQFAVPPSSNHQTGWSPLVRLEHLATHSAGFSKDGGYTAFDFQPGTAWRYSDGGPNWLAEIVTLAFGQDLRTVLQNRILTPIGADLAEFTWRDNQYRESHIEGIPRREFGSGMSSSVDVLARVGLLHLRLGYWKAAKLLPMSYIVRVSHTSGYLAGIEPIDPVDEPDATDRYGFLWWNNSNGQIPDVPVDVYFSWGQYDSTVAVVPSLQLVIVRAGPDSISAPSPGYTVWEPFFTPITQAVALPEPPQGASWLALLFALRGLARLHARRISAARVHGA